MIVKVLLVLGGMGVAVLGGMVWVFALGTASVRYELHLTLRDAAGLPLRLQPVLVWCYEYPIREFRTDSVGHLTLPGYQSFGTNVLTGPHRPDTFPIRLAFPGLSPLFYRFELRRDGPAPYQVFNTQYDYTWGHQWVGDFDTNGRVRSRLKPDKSGKVDTIVPPIGGQTLLWHPTAALRRLAKEGAGSHYSIELDLQQSGIEGNRAKP